MVSKLILGVAGAIGLSLLAGSDEDHDEVVEQTVSQLERSVPKDATIYSDHVDDGNPNPRSAVDSLSYVPDVVVKAGSANSLIVEVETPDSLANNGSDAVSQLEDFSVRGYRRVLVVPNGDTSDGSVEEFRDALDIDGELHISTPQDVSNLL